MNVYQCTVQFIICQIKQEERHAKWHSDSKADEGKKRYWVFWTWSMTVWKKWWGDYRKRFNQNINKDKSRCVIVTSTSQLLNLKDDGILSGVSTILPAVLSTCNVNQCDQAWYARCLLKFMHFHNAVLQAVPFSILAGTVRCNYAVEQSGELWDMTVILLSFL